MLSVENLQVHFPLRIGFWQSVLGGEAQYVRAVDGVTFEVKEGEILSLVGESGCGKTTTGRAILQLVEPSVLKGKIVFNGQSVLTMGKAHTREFRQQAQMIFQDPYQSLNPKDTIFDIVAEPLIVNHLLRSEEEKWDKVKQALEWAGLKPAEDFMARYPHELSGGQRQRVAIAGALILQPKFIVADEPVSMLDVSVRADILKLMLDIRNKQGISYLFITHDLSLAWVISDRIAIMYLGKIMEIGSADQILKRPLNPYSKALIEVMPKPEPRKGKARRILQGETPDPAYLPKGCRFHPRCPIATERCRAEEPCLATVGEGHQVACHYPGTA